MARVTLVIEDLPEGDADILEISVETDTEIKSDALTPAQEMAAIVIGIIEKIREDATNDSMSKVQDSD